MGKSDKKSSSSVKTNKKLAYDKLDNLNSKPKPKFPSPKKSRQLIISPTRHLRRLNEIKGEQDPKIIHVQYVSGMDLHSGTTSSDSASYFSEMSKSSRASDSRRNPRRNVRDKGIGQQLLEKDQAKLVNLQIKSDEYGWSENSRGTSRSSRGVRRNK